MTRRIDEIGDESRRRILDAAEKLFSQKGFERTSFIDIARESGISRGSIPWHFKSKEGLLIAVVERIKQRFLESLEVEAEEITAQMLLEMVSRLLRVESSRVLFMLLSEALHSEARVLEQYEEYMREQRRQVRRWLRLRGLEDRAKAEALAAMISSVTMGAQLQWHIDPEGFDLDKTLSVLAAMLDEELGAVDGSKGKASPRGRQPANGNGPRARARR